MSIPGKIICLHHALQAAHHCFDRVKSVIESAGFGISNENNTSFAEIWAFDTLSDLTDPDFAARFSGRGNSRLLMLWLGNEPLPAPVVWKVLGAGVNDVICWQGPNPAHDILINRLNRWLLIDRHVESPEVRETLSGSSILWKNTLRNLIETAVFSQAPVLIMGESGTGKEMAARLIHQFDIRPYKQELVLLDCAAVAPELSGSEFFGHEKGAFTNAMSSRDGAFATADKGTLFLDETGELPLSLQAELLRVVQEGVYKKLGSNAWKKTEFRLVCATNRNLEKEVAERRFREDLFYRISTWVCTLPPLRERRSDIPDLVQCFLKQFFPDPAKRPLIDPAVLAWLQTRDYPGNVRELRQVVNRIANRYAGGGVITPGDIPQQDRMQAGIFKDPLRHAGFTNQLQLALHEGKSLKTIINDVSEMVKAMAVEQAGGNLQKAAASLNVSDRTMQMYLSGKSER